MWITYSLIAMVMLGSMLLLIKQVSNGGAQAIVILFWLFLGGTIGAGAHLLVTRQAPRLAWMPLGLIGLTALCSYVGNLAYIKAVGLSPNPGYPVAIEGCKAALVLVLSIFLFHAGFSWGKAMGVALCAAGIYLVVR